MDDDLFFTESEERQFGLIVEDKKLYVSKESLAAFSPVFKRMIYGGFKEGKENQAELNGKTLVDVLEFLHVLFPVPQYRKEIDFDNIDLIFTLVEEYDVKQIRKECEQFLKLQLFHLPVGDKSVFKVAVLASKYWLTDIIRQCVPFLCAFSKAIFEEFKFQLDSKIVAAVLEAREIRSTLYDHKGIPLCSKCQIPTRRHGSLDSGCLAFHSDNCPGKSNDTSNCSDTKACLCGYVFDEKWFD